VAVNGSIPVVFDDVAGVDIAGIMIDAGEVKSPVLLRVGTKQSSNHRSDPANPTRLQDPFFRIGGPHAGSATVSLLVNSDDVILDNIWAWRADHGQVSEGVARLALVLRRLPHRRHRQRAECCAVQLRL